MSSPNPAGRRRHPHALPVLALLTAVACIPGSSALAQDPSSAVEPPLQAESQDWINAHTCGHLGIPCSAKPSRWLRVRVVPALATAGRLTRFRISVTSVSDSGARPARAVVSLGGRKVVTGADGRAVLVTRLGSRRRVAVIARRASTKRARAWLRVAG